MAVRLDKLQSKWLDGWPTKLTQCLTVVVLIVVIVIVVIVVVVAKAT